MNILFIQGGGEKGYEVNARLAASLQQILPQSSMLKMKTPLRCKEQADMESCIILRNMQNQTNLKGKEFCSIAEGLVRRRKLVSEG